METTQWERQTKVAALIWTEVRSVSIALVPYNLSFPQVY